jgi:putative glutathione S-transferase
MGHILVDGCTLDPHNPGTKSIRDLYELSGDTHGKYTVPVLWDTREKCIVNNESSDIMRMLNTAFEGHEEPDLYPLALRKEIDEINSFVYDNINDGVYRCGFAKTQAAYDTAVTALYSALDAIEERLATRKFLCGDALTEADIRLFMTLIRFDEVYVVYFKTNKRTIAQFPNLLRHTKDLFNKEEIGSTVDMKHIKTHYFTSHPQLNPFAIIPAGPDFLRTLKEAQP